MDFCISTAVGTHNAETDRELTPCTAFNIYLRTSAHKPGCYILAGRCEQTKTPLQCLFVAYVYVYFHSPTCCSCLFLALLPCTSSAPGNVLKLLPVLSASLLVGPPRESLSAVCVSHVPWPPPPSSSSSLDRLKLENPGLNHSTLVLPFSFSGPRDWIRVEGCLIWPFWLGSSPGNLRHSVKSSCAERRRACFALRVLFEWPSPFDKTKLKYSNVPGPQTLLPPSLHVSSYLHALPTLPLLPHTPPTSPGLACYRYAGCFVFFLDANSLRICVSLLLLCAPPFLCISNSTLTRTDRKLFSNMDAAKVADKHTYAQRGHGSYLVRAVTCPEARVWAFFFHVCCFDWRRSQLVSVRSSWVTSYYE